MSKKKIILASSSPRRRELLKYLTPDFDVVPSDIEETASGTPRQQAVKLAHDKALDVTRNHPDAVVIGADTLVVMGAKVLGKPKDKQDASCMLKTLSGRTHKVYTGVAVICSSKMLTGCEVTSVTFDTLSDYEISEYIETGEPMDKAGAYGIQGYGGKFIKKIDGCYFNVMGLPLNLLYRMLKNLGISV